MLLAVLFLVALILIALAVAAPKVAQNIQRDRELELMHRGLQYKRAVKLYYRKFGAYPSSIDQLVNTNQIKFLRKRYTDPMTGKDDWKIIHQGEQHVKVMGLFGQALVSTNNPATVGTSAAGLASNGLSGGLGSGTGSGFGSTPQSGSGVYGQSGTDGSQTGTSGSSSATGSSFGTTPGSTSGTTSATGLGSGTGGNTNPTFGGGPIVGVKISDTKASIKVYLQQKHYNEWEFVYDPLEDQLQGGGAMFGGAGANLNGVGNGTTNPTSPTSGFGGTGFGNSGTGFGTNPNPTPTPTPTPTPAPQQ